MDWANNLFLLLLLTDMTGTIFILIRGVFKRFVSDVKVLRFITDITLYAFLVPFVYVAVYASRRVKDAGSKSYSNMFYSTPLIFRIGIIFGCIWTGLFLVTLVHKLYRRHRWAVICKGNIPEEDMVIFKQFLDICTGFGIAGEVSLRRNDSVKSPCLTYHQGYMVILPCVEYTREETNVIFCHELCHYLNRDIHIKTIGCIVTVLHAFNPLVHILMGELDLICEKYCDRVACEKGMELYNRNEYLQIILDLLVDGDKKARLRLFALADNKSDYERRVEAMVHYEKHGALKKSTAFIVTAAFLLGSSSTSLAAGGGVVAAYDKLAEATSVKVPEEADVAADMDTMFGMDSEYKEILDELEREYDIDPADVIFVEDDGIETHGNFVNISWSVPKSKTYMSAGFTQEEGDSVSIMTASTPDDVTYQMGIKDPKFIMRYVEGEGLIAHEFEIKIKGRHYFFVCNLSETEDLDIEASIIRQSAEEEEEEAE